jgi:hypothetical protein
MLHIFTARMPESVAALHWVWASTREEAERRRTALAAEGELVSQIREAASGKPSFFDLQTLM